MLNEEDKDAACLRAVCEGLEPACRVATRELDRRNRSRFQRFFLRNRLAEAEAEDLVQETFLKVFRSACQFEGRNGSKASTWLQHVSRSILVSYLRWKQANHKETPFSVWQPQDNPDEFSLDDLIASMAPETMTYQPIDETWDLATKALHAYECLWPDRAIALRMIIEGETYEAIEIVVKKRGANARQYISECREKMEEVRKRLEAGESVALIIAALSPRRRKGTDT